MRCSRQLPYVRITTSNVKVVLVFIVTIRFVEVAIRGAAILLGQRDRACGGDVLAAEGSLHGYIQSFAARRAPSAGIMLV
jgi:hypothetical protein